MFRRLRHSTFVSFDWLGCIMSGWYRLPIVAFLAELLYLGCLCSNLPLCFGVNLLEPHRSLACDDISQRTGHANIFSLIFQHLGLSRFHFVIRPRRTKVLVVMANIVLMALVIGPVGFGSAIVPSVIHINRVVPDVASLAFKPRENAEAQVHTIVVIAKIIMAVTRAGK